MPTQVNPDNPNSTVAGSAQSMTMGARQPGTPSMAGKPGVQAGRPSTPAPPGPASSLPGRPAQPKPQPGTPAPGAPAPAAQASPAVATPPATPGSPQPAPGAGSSTTAPGVGAPPPPPTMDAAGGVVTQPMTSPTIPQPGSVMPGAAVQTPYGSVSTKPDGSQSLALDANGAQKYKETMAALRSKFITPRAMKGMHGLPQMELKLGAHNFDPFSGRFHGRD